MLLRLKTIHVSPWLRSPCQYTQNEKHTLPRVSPFTLKTFKARNSSSTDSDAFTLSETISHFRSYPCYLFVNSTQLTAFITPRQGACEQQLSQIDTEWREADAPLFTGPLTFLPEPFLMPSQPTCCKRAGRNKWKIVFFPQHFDHWRQFSSSSFFFGHFNCVFTHDAQRDGSSSETKTRITKCFLCLSLYFSSLFLQYRLRTSSGVPRTQF